MKRRFRWWLSAVLLYLLSVPIIFILIGLSALLVLIVGVSVGPGTAFLWMYVMVFLVSLLHSCVPFLSHPLFWDGFVREGSGD